MGQAKERQQQIEHWYKDTLGFKQLFVPPLLVSDEEFSRRLELPIPQQLFGQPSTVDASYAAILAAVGQKDHWTIGHNKIIWERNPQWKYFWAEVSENCPRTKKSWETLNQEINLLSLEEYFIVWHDHKVQTGQFLDPKTWTWLRTRYQLNKNVLGALGARGFGGEVYVYGSRPGTCSDAFGREGGRLAEVVKLAT